MNRTSRLRFAITALVVGLRAGSASVGAHAATATAGPAMTATAWRYD